MKRPGFFIAPLFLLTLLRAQAAPPATAGVSEAARQRVSASYGKLPLSFERNQGQGPREAEFVARGSGYTIMLLGERLTLNDLNTDAERRLSA